MLDSSDETRSVSPSEIWEKTAGIRIGQNQKSYAARDTDIDSLQFYLKDIGEMPVLSAERQQEIAEEMILCDEKMRSLLGRVGMVMQEHIRLLDEYEDEADLNDLFLPSTLSKYGDFISVSRKHRRKLMHFYERWQKAWESKDENIAEYRRDAAQLLMELPLGSEQMETCYQLLVDCKSFNLEDKQEIRNFLEKKFFMSLEEFQETVAAVEEVRRKLKALREEMLEGNLRLVISVAKAYAHPNISKGDLIQEGNIGLMKALEKFDFRLGNRFSTFATWWIRQYVTRAISRQGGIIRLPRHIINTIRAIKHAEQRYILEHGVAPENRDIAMMLEMPEPRISAIRKMAKQAISLQAPVKDAENKVLEDIIADESSVALSNPVNKNALQDTVREMLSVLSEREQQIIILRFGLFEQNQQTLEEISQMLGVTRERVRQLESKIIAKLRNHEILKITEKDS